MTKTTFTNPMGIQTFNHELFGEIRTMINEQGETFFVGKDVALALGYAKPQNALAIHVDEDDKTTALIQGTGSNYKTRAVLINESGLYSLILSSQLPSAKAFKRWVTSEVLPQIRRTGGYIPMKDPRTGEAPSAATTPCHHRASIPASTADCCVPSCRSTWASATTE